MSMIIAVIKKAQKLLYPGFISKPGIQCFLVIRLSALNNLTTTMCSTSITFVNITCNVASIKA